MTSSRWSEPLTQTEPKGGTQMELSACIVVYNGAGEAIRAAQPFRICHTFLTDRLVFTLRYGFTLSGSLFTGTTLTFRTFTGGFRLGLGTGDLLGDLLLYLSV